MIAKEIPGYGGFYSITEDGFVISNSKKFKYSKNKFLKNSITEDGYLFVRLQLNGGSKKCSIHRLIAISFIPNPNDYEQVNHMDGNKLNNSISNLEWCSRKQNMIHASINNLMQKGSSRPSSKLTESQAIEIKNSNLSGKQLSLIYGVSKNTVLLIKRGLKWKYLNSDNS